MTKIRYAIWAAVSTKAQVAEDKISIPDQIKRSRAVGEGKGWVESHAPFVVKGESRTKYSDLTQAERGIPELKALLDAAQNKEFDVVICFKLNRFRDLQEQVFRVLGSYGVQLFSVVEPVEPIIPIETFKHWKAKTMRVVVTLSMFASQSEMSDIREKYETGMPARIDRGLPASKPVYGYKRIAADRKAAPVQQRHLISHVLVMKNKLFKGESLAQIAAHFNEQKIPPPRGRQWWPQTIKGILINPFYYGVVRWGASVVEADLRTGRRVRNRKIPNEEVKYAKGIHKPIWDEATHKRILKEIDSHRINYKGRKNNQFTGLLACSVCGLPLHRQGNGARSTDRLIWRCSRTGSAVGHVNIHHNELLTNFAPALQRELSKRKYEDLELITTQDKEDTPAARKAKLKDLQTQRTRLEDIYLTGDIPAENYRPRARILDEQIKAAQKHLDNYQVNIKIQQQIYKNLKDLLPKIPEWLKHRDPQTTNYLLKTIIEKITITPDNQITIELK